MRAKIDRADAAMLARMGAALALKPQPVRPEVLQDLNDLMAAQRAMVKDRTATKNRAKGLRLAILSRLNRMRLSRIEADLQAIDRAILEIIEASPDLRARHEILVSIAGISEVTAAAILAMMPELGHLDRKQVASLAGLAPVTRQSGRWTGKAFIQGGRAALRQALYMPAVVACRFNPDLKAKYDQLITAGKPPKLAITAVMRKLVVLANPLIRDNRHWQAARA